MIDKKWKWVAKDDSAQVFVFSVHPKMLEHRWASSQGTDTILKTKMLVIEGNWQDSLHEIIHHEDGKIEFRKARPELKVDAPVWVRDTPTDNWKPRHFKNWTADGKIETWWGGLTSFTSSEERIEYASWNEYKLP